MSYPFSGLVVRWLQDSSSNPVSTVALKADIHVNLWDLSSGVCLDVGILFESNESLDALVIDLPWEVHKKDFLDLAPRLGSSRVLMAIFNENIELRDESDSRLTNIKIIKESDLSWKTEFKLIQLDISSCDFQHFSIGRSKCTRLKISIPKRLPDSENFLGGYIRFRLSNVPDEVFFTEFKPKDRHLLSSNYLTRLLDLRVNVLRGVPEELLLGNDIKNFKLNVIHVFAIVPRDVELPFYSEHYKGCRSLEDESVWNEYVRRDSDGTDEPLNIKNYLGYQWSERAKDDSKAVKDLIALGRFLKRLTSTWQNLRFLILVVLLGACGSGVWALAMRVLPETLFNSTHERKEEIVIILIIITIFFVMYIFKISFWRKVVGFFYYLPSRIKEWCEKFSSGR